jgi:hypothetical protein
VEEAKQPRASDALAVVRHEFGSEGSVYVRSYLEANASFGKRLGRLLTACPIEAGTTWAFVPADSAPERLVTFERSLFPPSGRAQRVEVGFMVPKFVPSANPAVKEALAGFLDTAGPASRLVCVEDSYRRRSDFRLPVDQWAHQVFFCGEDVYEFAGGEIPLEESARMLGGASWKPDVGLVTSLPEQLDTIEQGHEVTAEQLEEMAMAAVVVVIGAWDDDSFLFWEPPPP